MAQAMHEDIDIPRDRRVRGLDGNRLSDRIGEGGADRGGVLPLIAYESAASEYGHVGKDDGCSICAPRGRVEELYSVFRVVLGQEVGYGAMRIAVLLYGARTPCVVAADEP